MAQAFWHTHSLHGGALSDSSAHSLVQDLQDFSEQMNSARLLPQATRGTTPAQTYILPGVRAGVTKNAFLNKPCGVLSWWPPENRAAMQAKFGRWKPSPIAANRGRTGPRAYGRGDLSQGHGDTLPRADLGRQRAFLFSGRGARTPCFTEKGAAVCLRTAPETSSCRQLPRPCLRAGRGFLKGQ